MIYNVCTKKIIKRPLNCVLYTHFYGEPFCLRHMRTMFLGWLRSAILKIKSLFLKKKACAANSAATYEFHI